MDVYGSNQNQLIVTVKFTIEMFSYFCCCFSLKGLMFSYFCCCFSLKGLGPTVGFDVRILTCCFCVYGGTGEKNVLCVVYASVLIRCESCLFVYTFLFVSHSDTVSICTHPPLNCTSPLSVFFIYSTHAYMQNHRKQNNYK